VLLRDGEYLFAYLVYYSIFSITDSMPPSFPAFCMTTAVLNTTFSILEKIYLLYFLIYVIVSMKKSIKKSINILIQINGLKVTISISYPSSFLSFALPSLVFSIGMDSHSLDFAPLLQLGIIISKYTFP
jgi:hypothetical protein